ncbi:MAG: glycosyltransferase family 2 protein [Bacteroidia bacterium]
MQIFIKRKLNIVATLLAKNEEDIIQQNIEHHINQGVTKFVFTNNNSTDKTRSIVEKYPEVVEIIDETEDNHNQSVWVTRMSQIACKLKPDWIIHLDADELWGGLYNLKKIKNNIASCERMLMHPPVFSETFNLNDYRFYLNFDNVPIPQECKVAHRPNPDYIIEFGNHGIKGFQGEFTREVFRHHYPIRTLQQWQRKTSGHIALQKRNVCCKRWERWYNSNLDSNFNLLCQEWESYLKLKDHNSFMKILELWSEKEVIEYFDLNKHLLPTIGEWPK